MGVSPSPLQALARIALDHYFLVLITFLLPESLHHQRRTTYIVSEVSAEDIGQQSQSPS